MHCQKEVKIVHLPTFQNPLKNKCFAPVCPLVFNRARYEEQLLKTPNKKPQTA
jgi:hypothetical protein